MAYAGDAASGVTSKDLETQAVVASTTLSSVAVSSITQTKASLTATSNKNGFIYYSVRRADADTPTANDVKIEGAGTNTTSLANTVASIPLTGLDAGTKYKVRCAPRLS